MKKFICIIMLLALTFSGCNTKADIISSTNSNSTIMDGAFPIDKTTELKMQEHQFPLGGKSKNGYYYLTSRQDASKNINYIDYATLQDIVLCNRPECTHDTESCGGWISHTGNSNSPLIIGEKLYIISTGSGEAYYKMYGEKALSKIEAMDLNGDNKKLLCQFLPSDTLMGQMAYNNNFLYAICQKIKNENGKVKVDYYIIGVDLSTGIIEEKLVEDIVSPELIGVIDNKLLMKGMGGTENLTEVSFTAFATDGKDTKKLYSWANSKAMNKVYKGKLYSVNRMTSEVKEVDVKSGNERIICERLTEKALSTTGIAYFFDNKMQVVLFLKNGEIIQNVVNLEDGTKSEIKLIMKSDHIDKKYDSYVEIVDIINDKFLVTNSLSYKEILIPNTNGTTVALAEPMYQFALINKEEFLSNIPNYNNIEKDKL